MRRVKGTGQVFEVGQTWHIRYTVNCKRRQESTGSSNRRDAVRLLNKRLGEIADGRYTGPDPERTTFAEIDGMIANHHKGTRSETRAKGARKHLWRHLGMLKANALTYARLAEYIKDRLNEGAAPATVAYEKAILRIGLGIAVKSQKLVQLPPFPSIRVENTRTGFFEESELEAVCAELKDLSVRNAVRFEYHTGWRGRSEVLTRQWKHVDFKAGVVRLEPDETKSGKGRTFPFDVLPELCEVLEEQREYTEQVQYGGRIIPWIFHRNGKPIKDFYGAWRTACAAAGLVGKIPHDLRRTAVRNLERAGVPRSVSMQLVGHETEAIYNRYAIVSESDLRAGVEKLAALECGPRQVLPFRYGEDKAQTAGARR